MSAHLKNVLKYFGGKTMLLHTGLLVRATFWSGAGICGDGFMLYVDFNNLSQYKLNGQFLFLMIKLTKVSLK